MGGLKCLLCGGGWCGSCAFKCKDNTATRNQVMIQALSMLRVPRALMHYKKQTQLTRDIVKWMNQNYRNDIDVNAVFKEWSDKVPVPVEIQKQIDNPVKRLKCEFNVGLDNEKCIHCLTRPKWHVDKFGGDCEALLNMYKQWETAQSVEETAGQPVDDDATIGQDVDVESQDDDSVTAS